MNQTIKRLDTWLRENRPEYYAGLRYGVSKEELVNFEADLGFELPSNFKELYHWRNGQTNENQKAFLFDKAFISLEEIKSIRDLFNDLLAQGSFEQPNWWHPQWIPFLDDSESNNLCLDLNGSFEGNKGQVLDFWHDWEDRSIQYPSFETFLLTFVESLEQNMWIEEDNEFNPVSEAEWASFQSTRNHGYPKEVEAG